jgi:DNA-binding NtrC family response regulator
MAGAPFLIVSDDIDIQDAYVYFLRRARIAAVSAPSADGALSFVRETPPRAVLYDVITASDWVACGELRAHLPTPSPMVVLTAWVSPDRVWREQARRIGCVAFLAKPCDPQTVLETLIRATAGEPWIEHTNGV